VASQINLSLTDIYKELCSKCQEKVKDMVKDKLADQAIKDALEGKDKDDNNV